MKRTASLRPKSDLGFGAGKGSLWFERGRGRGKGMWRCKTWSVEGRGASSMDVSILSDKSWEVGGWAGERLIGCGMLKTTPGRRLGHVHIASVFPGTR